MLRIEQVQSCCAIDSINSHVVHPCCSDAFTRTIFTPFPHEQHSKLRSHQG